MEHDFPGWLRADYQPVVPGDPFDDISDCGPDGGCIECDVCLYLAAQEEAAAVGAKFEGDPVMDAYLKQEHNL